MNVQFCLQSTDTFDTFLAKRTKLSAISADRSISFFFGLPVNHFTRSAMNTVSLVPTPPRHFGKEISVIN